MFIKINTKEGSLLIDTSNTKYIEDTGGKCKVYFNEYYVDISEDEYKSLTNKLTRD